MRLLSSPRKRILYTSFLKRVKKFRLLVTIAIIERPLTVVPSNVNETYSFVNTHSIFSGYLIRQLIHLYLLRPTHIVLKVNWHISYFNRLTQDKVVTVKYLLAFLNSKEGLINIEESIFRKINLLHTLTSHLILKTSITWPHLPSANPLIRIVCRNYHLGLNISIIFRSLLCKHHNVAFSRTLLAPLSRNDSKNVKNLK